MDPGFNFSGSDDGGGGGSQSGPESGGHALAATCIVLEKLQPKFLQLTKMKLDRLFEITVAGKQLRPSAAHFLPPSPSPSVCISASRRVWLPNHPWGPNQTVRSPEMLFSACLVLLVGTCFCPRHRSCRPLIWPLSSVQNLMQHWSHCGLGCSGTSGGWTSSHTPTRSHISTQHTMSCWQPPIMSMGMIITTWQAKSWARW